MAIFPSEFVHPNEKTSDAYLLQYAEATVQESRTNSSVSKMGKSQDYVNESLNLERYFEGRQDPNIAKEILSPKIKGSKEHRSYRNINWAILKIVPR